MLSVEQLNKFTVPELKAILRHQTYPNNSSVSITGIKAELISRILGLQKANEEYDKEVQKINQLKDDYEAFFNGLYLKVNLNLKENSWLDNEETQLADQVKMDENLLDITSLPVVEPDIQETQRQRDLEEARAIARDLLNF